ncbi:hypothetical protein L1280_002862 [Deinococcus sp. HSC-46F16]|uniref:hypothetical protein n=1 Tax=Deinococcus sp. HSC-46F16 TaxID=2910968 RepID=UPI00209F5066|nr:hypothetical protein [Deinococcus sp. HSC-46F16]MCP2015686.1 hypothetical protein [Deinococcus sp. HSC-46F16]
MTRDERNDESGTKQNATGDIQPDTGTDLTDQEAAKLNANPGRGARQEPGAQASDEYVDDHIEGTASATPNIPDIDPNTGKS